MQYGGVKPDLSRHADVLPDSRAVRATGSVRGPGGANWIPVYCHNCGVSAGLVPEENCTFAFFLCGPEKNNCQEKWGIEAHHMVEPDTVFWERVAQEQLEKYARLLGPIELLKELEDAESPLAKLLKERMAQGPL